jgi:hypothetical protein
MHHACVAGGNSSSSTEQLEQQPSYVQVQIRMQIEIFSVWIGSGSKLC